jgi:hypothetical protein
MYAKCDKVKKKGKKQMIGEKIVPLLLLQLH